ncbi:MAG TPA: glycine/betaine ABC transporter ATP-binding protein, partial [Erysipelotrichaceae bacterium]|nr:glycine/betaine ABC transporter ATP-binding protein [Erysipelotrichaceae bacterium]
IALRRSIGYVIQGSVLFPHMNVEENIAYVLKLLHKSKEEI